MSLVNHMRDWTKEEMVWGVTSEAVSRVWNGRKETARKKRTAWVQAGRLSIVHKVLRIECSTKWEWVGVETGGTRVRWQPSS